MDRELRQALRRFRQIMWVLACALPIQSANAQPAQTTSPPQVVAIPGVPKLAGASPNVGQPGRSKLVILITGENTHFAQGATTVDFGSDISLDEPPLVVSETLIIVKINIVRWATLAPHAIVATTNREKANCAGCFSVEIPEGSDLTDSVDGEKLGAWDQTFPAAARWVVLYNFNYEAILDRNTGLVWERTPSESLFDEIGFDTDLHCLNRVVGGQKGFRVPSAAELTSLIDMNSPSKIPEPNPFHLFDDSAFTIFQSSTRGVDDRVVVVNFKFDSGEVFAEVGPDSQLVFKFHFSEAHSRRVWCVRGGGNFSSHYGEH